MESKVTAVILNYNTWEDTIRLANKLLEDNPKINIVIVDNNSPNNSFSKLKGCFENHERVECIKSVKNGGYSYGNNIGIKFAQRRFKSEYILISNPDVIIPSRDFIMNLISYLDADNNLAGITGLIHNYQGKVSLNGFAWKIPAGFDDVFLNIGLLSKFFNPVSYSTLDEPSPVCKGVYYVDVIPGSLFVIRSKVIEEIGFLDEKTFLYCEERILGLKIKKMGLRMGVSLSDRYIHNHLPNYNFKHILWHYILLLKSRLYYNWNYNKYGKIVLPFFIFSALVGALEKTVFLGLKHSTKLYHYNKNLSKSN